MCKGRGFVKRQDVLGQKAALSFCHTEGRALTAPAQSGGLSHTLDRRVSFEAGQPSAAQRVEAEQAEKLPCDLCPCDVCVCRNP